MCKHKASSQKSPTRRCFTINQGAAIVYKDSDSLANDIKAVTQAFSVELIRKVSQTMHAGILTNSMSLLRQVKRRMNCQRKAACA